MASPNAKAPIEPFQFARNGKYPDALFQAEIAAAANRCAKYRMKQLANFWSDTFPGTFGDGERVRWRFRFVASPYVSQILFKATLAQTTVEGAASRPRVRILIEEDDGTDVAQGEIEFGASTALGSSPNLLGHLANWVKNTAGTTAWQPTANTEYQATISDFDNGRCIAASIYELPLDLTPPFSEGYGVGGPIFDADRGDITAGARQMWKTQAAPLFHWTVDVAASPRTRTSATAANIIDTSVTTGGADKPGWTLDLRNKSRTSTGTVPVKLWVYAGMSADEGEVKLIDAAGSDVGGGSMSITGAAAWHSTTFSLPATLAKYDLHYASNGSDTISVYHASLIQHL